MQKDMAREASLHYVELYPFLRLTRHTLSLFPHLTCGTNAPHGRIRCDTAGALRAHEQFSVTFPAGLVADDGEWGPAGTGALGQHERKGRRPFQSF